MFLNLKDPTGINVETIVVSAIGAIIVIFVANQLLGTGRRRSTVRRAANLHPSMAMSR